MIIRILTMLVVELLSSIRLKAIFPTIFKSKKIMLLETKARPSIMFNWSNEMSESLGKKVAKMELIILIPLGMIQLILNTNQNHHWASASLKIVSDH